MDDDFLKRIDRHMERGNEHMERGNRHMERGNVLMAQLMETSQRQIQATEDLRVALNQMNMRQERITAQLSETIAENTRTLREGRREFVEEMRAQRTALFRVLDRLDGGGSAATA